MLRRNAGRDSWLVWQETSFGGGRSTTYCYMRLAREISNPETLHGLSLRQAYFLLGIATEPKTSVQQTHPVQPLPELVVLAQKLLCLLRNRQKLSAGCMDDLAMLYRQLRVIFWDVAISQSSEMRHGECRFCHGENDLFSKPGGKAFR
jgi:hypothetical protein